MLDELAKRPRQRNMTEVALIELNEGFKSIPTYSSRLGGGCRSHTHSGRGVVESRRGRRRQWSSLSPRGSTLAIQFAYQDLEFRRVTRQSDEVVEHQRTSTSTSTLSAIAFAIAFPWGANAAGSSYGWTPSSTTAR